MRTISERKLELDFNRGPAQILVHIFHRYAMNVCLKARDFARESLDADATTGPAFQAGPLLQLISGLRKGEGSTWVGWLMAKN
jgi:hypothetical protein